MARADCFASVCEVIVRLEAAREPAALVQLLRDASPLLGADVAAFVSFISDGDCEAFRFLLACDPQWCIDYEREGWYADDPWLRYARRHAEPIRANEIESASAAETAVMRLAERYGFRSAVIVPAPSSGGLSRLGMLCLGSDEPGYYEGDGFSQLKVMARPLAAALLEASIRSSREEMLRLWHISERDLQLLECQRRGLQSKDMALQLGITTKAIDSSFQRLNVKLGVLRRGEAATLAAEYGLI